jgi:hypothetical protein
MNVSLVIAAAAFSIGVTGSVYAADGPNENTGGVQSSNEVVKPTKNSDDVVQASKNSDDQRSTVRLVEPSGTRAARRRDVNDSPTGSDPATGIPYSAPHGYGFKRW